MSAIWSQSLKGRAIDMLQPRADDVDFHEIAETLARLNRYAGASTIPVSVGQHTLIAIAATPPALQPWVALHDAHEYVIGDIPTPAKQALLEFAAARGGAYQVFMAEALRNMAHVHDVAIHQAAGLPLPTEEQRAEIKLADLRALMTERRDFLAKPPRAWDFEHIAPLPRAFRPRPWPDVADQLYREFQHLLPSLRA